MQVYCATYRTYLNHLFCMAMAEDEDLGQKRLPQDSLGALHNGDGLDTKVELINLRTKHIPSYFYCHSPLLLSSYLQLCSWFLKRPTKLPIR